MAVKAQWWKTKKQFYPGIGFPLLLIVIGMYFLLKSLGYIADDVPFWSILIIAIGVYLLGKRIYIHSR